VDSGHGAERGGAQPTLGRLQERHRLPACGVADRFFDRAEGRGSQERGARGARQALQIQGGDGALQRLRQHPKPLGLQPRPLCLQHRVQGLLFEDEGRLSPLSR